MDEPERDTVSPEPARIEMLLEPDYQWPSAQHLHAFMRAKIDEQLRPIVDGRRVPAARYAEFQHEWSLWYDARTELHGHICGTGCADAMLAEMAALTVSVSDTRKAKQ